MSPDVRRWSTWSTAPCTTRGQRTHVDMSAWSANPSGHVHVVSRRIIWSCPRGQISHVSDKPGTGRCSAVLLETFVHRPLQSSRRSDRWTAQKSEPRFKTGRLGERRFVKEMLPRKERKVEPLQQRKNSSVYRGRPQ